jgi:hypothetical protein
LALGTRGRACRSSRERGRGRRSGAASSVAPQKQCFQELQERLVVPSVELIRGGDKAGAAERFIAVVREAKRRYL